MPKSIRLLQSDKLAFGLLLIIALSLISLRAYLFWQNYQTINKPAPVLASTAPAQETSKRPVSELVSLHLFGRPLAVIETAPEPVENLPETRLRLTLRGISAGTGDNPGGALVEGENRKTDFYRVGTKLPGNVKLHAVYADRIILDRKGKLENLSFPEKWEKSTYFQSVRPTGARIKR